MPCAEAAGPSSEGAEVETVAAAGIENDIVRRCGQHLRDCIEQRPGYAAIVQSAPSCDSSRCIAGLTRPAVLRLEQIDVSAAGDIERMPTRTDHAPIGALEWRAAAADGAQEHASSVADEKSAVNK